MFASEIRKRLLHDASYFRWQWHLDEVFVKINGEKYYLWRAVDFEGEVLEVFATKRRDRRSALEFLKWAIKRCGRPGTIVTDRLQSYGAAMKEVGILERQECGGWLSKRAENSHQPFRQRERTMIKFRSTKALQKLVLTFSSVHNHFNYGRHLYIRENFRLNRSNALALWRQLAACGPSNERFYNPTYFSLKLPIFSMTLPRQGREHGSSRIGERFIGHEPSNNVLGDARDVVVTSIVQ